jgi:hypothetical protein
MNWSAVSFITRTNWRAAMSDQDFAEKRSSDNVPRGTKLPVIISKNDARQGHIERRVLYVLGFGTAGAIFVNMTVFLYFLSFHASG